MNENRPPPCRGTCHNPTTIHFTQIINGEMQKLDMCAVCPYAKHMQDPLEFGLMEKLLGIAMQKGLSVEKVGRELKCPNCGYTEAKFKKTGRLGCPECYKVFLSNKTEVLMKIQDAVLHKGKVPKNQPTVSVRKSTEKVIDGKKIEELNQELQQCILCENYERAAEIRDEIKVISKQLETKVPAKKVVKKKSIESKKKNSKLNEGKEKEGK